MIGYWTHFVTAGVPDFPGAPQWRPLNGYPANGPRMSFEPGGSHLTTAFEEDHQCPFWASVAG